MGTPAEQGQPILSLKEQLENKLGEGRLMSMREVAQLHGLFSEMIADHPDKALLARLAHTTIVTHAHQEKRLDSTEYATHPLRTAIRGLREGKTAVQIGIRLLHDAPEDQGLTKEQLAGHLTGQPEATIDDIWTGINTLNKNNYPDDQAYYAGITAADQAHPELDLWGAKIADRFDNISCDLYGAIHTKSPEAVLRLRTYALRKTPSLIAAIPPDKHELAAPLREELALAEQITDHARA